MSRRIRPLLCAALVPAALAATSCTGDMGSQGARGLAASCTVTYDDVAQTATIVCSDGTTATIASGANGTDGTGCTVVDNGDGTKTITCADGTTTTVVDGTNGANGGNAAVTNFHGEAALAATELEEANKYPVDIAITDVTADDTGLVTVSFTVTADGTPVTTIASVSAGIFKLEPPAGGLSYSRWVPYLWRTETVSGTVDAEGNPFKQASGFTVNQGYRESNGTLTNVGDGAYTYAFAKNLATATMPDGSTLVGYDRTLTHRVSIYTGGHSGPTGEGDLDFVPDGSALSLTRNIVETATCQKCHGAEFAGHGGDRVTVEGCNGCHSSGSYDAQSGESIEMAVMIHKIHAGWELSENTGPDGVFWDNPWTASDETADNGPFYILWGHSTTPVSWEKTEFPAVLANCEACHTGSGAQVDNWKTVPSRAACGSCHDSIDWAGGINHMAVTSDSGCAGCHPATGTSKQAVATAHAWTTKDIRNIPEFDVAVTTDTPVRGYYVAGERPVVSIALTDHFTSAVIVPNTVVEDTDGGEGCVPQTGAEATTCTVTRDGTFRSANVYVTGPRGQRIPVLTYAARAKVTSADVGPWDLSAATATERTLRIKVDSGMPMLAYNNVPEYEGYGADELISGDISVTLSQASLTPADVAAELNADPLFAERAFAYVDEALAGNSASGCLSIRTRGISKKNADGEVIAVTAQPNIQILASPVGIFTDLTIRTAGGASQARIRSTASNTDPLADFTDPTVIKYTLDPVDNLVPGTYVVNVEFADASRGPGNPPEPPYVDYRTPSVAVATFQVGQATEEKPIAAACTSCHWSTAGVGFVLDNPRHNKIFDEQAVDQCGGCHMYKSGMKEDTAVAVDFGAKPLSRRVHAVHNGSALNYPTLTVGHEETSAFGRNWDITYPMDVRNCESCHPAGATSGTWATNPNRLACMGCHDSDEATAHMKANVVDPTPLAPWSGDELEACRACH